MTLPELLAPAGGMDHLKAAVENGADAVYMGGRAFNARQNAENFDDAGMRQAMEYAHARGANVYVTMNTLIADGEMQRAVDEAGQTYAAGADALIVQDLGFASLLRKHLPGHPLHLSTQGTVYSADGIRALEPLGFSRVILARELSLSEITEAAKGSPVPVEVFAHGALCVCYSGQCLMSSMIGARSGNRGKCAQPCRLPYRLGKAQGYLLSPKDLCSLELLPEIVGTGVAALKIEGRMKSPEYVAVVTNVYRKYLDRIGEGKPHAVDPEDMQDLLQAFNRGGFATGYLQGRLGRDLICRERPKHWGVPVGTVTAHGSAAGLVTAQLSGAVSMGDGVEIANDTAPGNIVTYLSQNGCAVKQAGPGRAVLGTIRGDIKPGDAVYRTSSMALNERAAASYSGKPRRKVPVEGAFTARAGEPLRLTVWDRDGHMATAAGTHPAEEAVTVPLTQDAVLTQIGRTGDTPFTLAALRVELDGQAAAKLSELNALRRDALERLLLARSSRHPGRRDTKIHVESAGSAPKPAEARLSLFFWQWRDEYASILNQADRVYIPFTALAKEKAPRYGWATEAVAWLPPVTNGSYNQMIRAHAANLAGMGVSGVLIGNPEHLELLKGCGLPLVAGGSLNTFNGWTLAVCARLGLRGATLSHELTMEQIAALPDTGIDKEAAVYGRLPVMVSAHCPVGAECAGASGAKHCGLCGTGDAYELVDRTGARFPVVCDWLGCRSTILNADVLAVPGLLGRLAASGVSMLRLYVYDEPPEEISRIVKLYRRALDGDREDGLKGKGYTKGHYFRGVLQ